MKKKERIYLSLGTNLGDRTENLRSAVSLIGQRLGRPQSVSKIYESESWGYDSPHPFYNICVGLEISLDPQELLDQMQSIEQDLGRERPAGKGNSGEEKSRWKESAGGSGGGSGSGSGRGSGSSSGSGTDSDQDLGGTQNEDSEQQGGGNGTGSGSGTDSGSGSGRDLGGIQKTPGPYSDRLIDIDLIFMGSRVLRLPGLQVPHPSMEDRRFVLKPLAEIAPSFIHPVSGFTVSELLAKCKDPGTVHATGTLSHS